MLHLSVFFKMNLCIHECFRHTAHSLENCRCRCRCRRRNVPNGHFGAAESAQLHQDFSTRASIGDPGGKDSDMSSVVDLRVTHSKEER